MKGLLKKDLYMAWAYSKVVLLMVVIFLVASAFADNGLFFLLYPLIIVTMLPVSLLGYDERFKWNVFCDALPLSRAQQVTEKYLLTLIFSGCVFVLLALAQGIRLLPAGRIGEFWELLAAMLLFALISPSLILPFMFKLGTEKGRIAYYVFLGVLLILVLLLSSMGLVGSSEPRSGPLGILLSLVIGVLLFVGSWRLAIRWYEKREF